MSKKRGTNFEVKIFWTKRALFFWASESFLQVQSQENSQQLENLAPAAWLRAKRSRHVPQRAPTAWVWAAARVQYEWRERCSKRGQASVMWTTGFLVKKGWQNRPLANREKNAMKSKGSTALESHKALQYKDGILWKQEKSPRKDVKITNFPAQVVQILPWWARQVAWHAEGSRRGRSRGHRAQAAPPASAIQHHCHASWTGHYTVAGESCGGTVTGEVMGHVWMVG